MIEKITDKSGYVELIDFINAQLVLPTPGDHSFFIGDITNNIPVNDFYIYVQELYDEFARQNFKATLAITQTYKVVLLVNSEVIGINNELAEVYTVINFSSEGTEINSVFTATLNLYNTLTGAVVGQIQFFEVEEFGTRTLQVFYKIGSDIIYRGIFNSQLFIEEIGGSYLVKIDKDVVSLLYFKSAKDRLCRFQVEVSEGIFKKYTYKTIGELMSVQDTLHSRASLRILDKKGVIFFDE